jgi:hypothetical protein
MSEFSMFWTTNGTGDGLVPYTQNHWQEFLSRTFLHDITSEGVLPGFGDELEVTTSGSTISVAVGAAVVVGWPYYNNAGINFTPIVPSATTAGHIILRANWTAQTVRAVQIQAADGVTVVPTLTQVDESVWEIRLASYQITSGGIITLTDTREFCRYATRMIWRRQGGDASSWASAGTTEYRPSMVEFQCGMITWTGAAANTGSTTITLPEAYANNPLAFVTPVSNPTGGLSFAAAAISASQFTLFWRLTDSGETATSLTFQWMTIGPVA